MPGTSSSHPSPEDAARCSRERLEQENERLRMSLWSSVRGTSMPEERLAQEESRADWYRGIIEHAADAIFLKDTSGHYLLVNPALAALFGCSVEEIVGKRDQDLFGSETQAVVRAQDQQVLQSGKPLTFENRLRFVNEERICWTLKYPLISPQGETIGVAGIARDVTEGKRLVEALQQAHAELETQVAERTRELTETNARLEREMTEHRRDQEALQKAADEIFDLYNQAPVGYHSLDPEGRILRINDTELAWLGYAREELTGRVYADILLTPKSQQIFQRCFPLMQSQGWLKDVVLDLRRKDGSTMPVLLSATSLRDEAGRMVKSRSTVYDLTERKRMIDDLQRSERSLANAQRIANLGSWDLDLASGILCWSEEVYRIFGMPPEEFGSSYQAFLERVHPDDRARVRQAVNEALHGKGCYDLDHRIVRPDGSERIVHEQAEVDVDEHGQPVAISGTVQDVTEYRQALSEIARHTAELQQARELDRLKTDFVNAVSHDLRSPLTTIRGYAEFLEEQIAGPLNDQQRDFITQIQKSTFRLENLVNDLLDFARMEAGTFRLETRPCDVRTLIRDIAESLGPHIEGAKLSLRLVLAPEMPEVRMDARRIERVLTNLIGNAIKFTPEGGTLEVRASRDDSQLRIEVSDTGIGIDPADMPKLFKRFSQLEQGARKGGTGLGLNISKGIVEAHRGKIGVDSQVNRGSTFWFTLPLSAEES